MTVRPGGEGRNLNRRRGFFLHLPPVTDSRLDNRCSASHPRRGSGLE